MPKASVERNWGNQKRIQFTAMQEEQLYAECGQDERTSVYQSYCVFSLLFWKTNLNNVRYSIHGNLLPVFSTDSSPLDLRRNKTTSSSKSTNPFSAARKSLLLCISQFQLRPAVVVLTEDGAFALCFRPHPGGFDNSRVPTPGICHPKKKKC